MELRDLFLEAVAEQPAPSWLEVWHLLIGHPWFQSRLRCCARRVLREQSAPPQWLEDVEQEVLLLMGCKLRQQADLNVDPRRARTRFSGWLTTIIDRDCRQAIRRLRRLHGREIQLDAAADVAETPPCFDADYDLVTLIGGLDDPYRTILQLFGKGFSCADIGRQLGMSYSQAYRRLREGLRQLSRIIRERGDCDYWLN